MNLNTPLAPSKSAGIRRVVITGRTSTVPQDMQLLDSPHRHAQTRLEPNDRGETKIRLLGERASGWLVDRVEDANGKVLLESKAEAIRFRWQSHFWQRQEERRLPSGWQPNRRVEDGQEKDLLQTHCGRSDSPFARA